MSNVKHTPGPWDSHNGRVFTNSPEALILGRGAGVCSVYIDSEDDEEGLANTALIAAAPELLRNLQFAVDLLTPIASHTVQIERMRAAIAKAKGE